MKTCFHSHFYANFHASVTLLTFYGFIINPLNSNLLHFKEETLVGGFQINNMQCTFIAHRIRISDILSLVRNSYLTHVILPRLLSGSVHLKVTTLFITYSDIFTMPIQEILGTFF